MAGNHGSGASRPLSTSDFNARAKALSERLGEVAKPQAQTRQNWRKPKPAPAAPAEPTPEAPREEGAEGEPEGGGTA